MSNLVTKLESRDNVRDVDDSVVVVGLQIAQTSPDFVMHHASMPQEAFACVLKLMPGMVLEQPMTWVESMTMPRNLDKAYGMDGDVLERLSMTIPNLLSWHYTSREDVVSAGPTVHPSIRGAMVD